MNTSNAISITHSFHSDLKIANELVYDPCGLELTNAKLNSESREYGACSFELDGKVIEHRASKITPTKNGQFVTIWKRSIEGLTQPFNHYDELDYIIITARSGNKMGQFIFPKSILAEKGIITSEGKSGKRGIRVYPPWDIPTSKQSEKTQNWQLKYFLMIEIDIDFKLAKNLFTTTI